MIKTNTIKLGEATSIGHIFDQAAKNKESRTINDQINAFFSKGGKVTTLPK